MENSETIYEQLEKLPKEAYVEFAQACAKRAEKYAFAADYAASAAYYASVYAAFAADNTDSELKKQNEHLAQLRKKYKIG